MRYLIARYKYAIKTLRMQTGRYSRGQKKRDTRCYSDTYHRREMKLVPFFIEKCPL